MIDKLIPWWGREPEWTFTILHGDDAVTIRIGSLEKREFERLYAETVELEIAKEDIGAFLKRWIEEDEGEWVEIDGERYP